MPRLPTYLWVEAVMREQFERGIGVYIRQRGEMTGGIVLLSLFHQIDKTYRLFIQQRDLDGRLQWVAALRDEDLSAAEVDSYIQKSIARDPDLWVVEIEGKDFFNPFEDIV